MDMVTQSRTDCFQNITKGKLNDPEPASDNEKRAETEKPDQNETSAVGKPKFPFKPDPTDHCETSEQAYEDI